jgi:transcriptional regulator with XRE-family HTH domain
MDENINKLGALIESARKENGLSRSELAKLMGYKNVPKGIRRITDIEAGVNVKAQLLQIAFKALGLDVIVVHQAMADDYVGMVRTLNEAWLNSRRTIKRMLEVKRCERCPFFREGSCYNALVPQEPRKVVIAKYVGCVRPRWCPLGFYMDYDKFMFEDNMYRSRDNTIPFSIVVNEKEVYGRISDLNPKGLIVTIISPYSGYRLSAPSIANVVMGVTEWYSYDLKLTAKGDRVARELLVNIYKACTKVEENLSELSALYQDKIMKYKNISPEDFSVKIDEAKRELRKKLRSGEISIKEYESSLLKARREVKDMEMIVWKQSVYLMERARSEFDDKAAGITGMESCGDLLRDIVSGMMKQGNGYDRV